MESLPVERIIVSRSRLATLSSFIGPFWEDWIYVGSDWPVPPRYALHLAGTVARKMAGVWWDWDIGRT